VESVLSFSGPPGNSGKLERLMEFMSCWIWAGVRLLRAP
jgi:hypothetical protein